MRLDDLTVPMRALRLLAVDFPHLPAPFVHLSPVGGQELELSLHDVDLTHETFTVFETWREALGIAPEAVAFRVQANGRTRVLRAEGAYGGAEIVLTAYADQPAPDRGEAFAAGGAA